MPTVTQPTRASATAPLNVSLRTTLRTKERPPDNTIFGYAGSPDSPVLGRDVFKWLQSLDMSHAVKNPRRDLCNGFIMAEVFSRFFPADVQMHSFQNGTSSQCKESNWGQVRKCARKHEVPLPDKLVAGVMDGTHGAATALLEHLYQHFTGKKVQRMPNLEDMPGLKATTMASLPALSFGEAPAPVEAPGLKTISKQPANAQNVEFGAVQTEMAGDAMALRRKFAGA